MRQRPRVKICCIQNVAEAELAVRVGASAVGLVSAMPSGPGVIDEATIAAIAARVPPGVATFLLTSLTTSAAIIAQQRRCGCNTLQLVDSVPIADLQAIRAALPGIALVQVIHVIDDNALAQAVAVAPYVHALLLDSGNPGLAVKELGGTGRTHDWQISRQICAAVPVPVWLAGGLRPHNVAQAIASVAPFGLDICSGVRVDGHLAAPLLADFMAAVGD